ncbi:MAG: hypothetical protein ACP5J0_03080 [Pyrobaculum sp.]
MATPKQMEIRQRFREAAKVCKAQVAHLPKGQRLQAYRQCMAQQLRKK